MFSFHHWFLLSFLGVFIADCVCSLHHCFFRCFFFCFFFSPLILLLFFECFHFTKFLYRDCFLSVTSFLCCCTTNATDLRELFLLSGVLYLTLRPEIWHNLLLSRLPWGRQFSLQVCRAFHWCSKHRPGPTVCLSHTVQQTVFVARFYLCIKVLRNTI